MFPPSTKCSVWVRTIKRVGTPFRCIQLYGITWTLLLLALLLLPKHYAGRNPTVLHAYTCATYELTLLLPEIGGEIGGVGCCRAAKAAYVPEHPSFLAQKYTRAFLKRPAMMMTQA